VTKALRIGNRGTGPLTLTDPVGTTLAPGLSVAAVPPPVPPGGHGDLGLSFTGQSGPASSFLVYPVASTDTTAVSRLPDDGREADHTNLISLTVTSHPPMPALAGGDILVTDFADLVRINPSTGLQTSVASGGVLEWVSGVAVEHTGDLLCSTFDAVVRVDRTSGTFRILSEGGALLNVGSLAIAPDRSVLVMNTGNGEITRVHPGTGAQSQAFGGGGRGASRIAMAPDGSVLMTGGGSVGGVSFAELVRIDLATGTSTVLIRREEFAFDGLAVAPDGVVFVVANQDSAFGAPLPLFFESDHMLIRYDPATGQQTVVFNRPDLLLRQVLLTPRGEPLLTGTVWPDINPSLLRLDPGGAAGGDWPVHEVSVGGLLADPNALAIVPPAAG
jgi:hypothetical protein